MSRKVKTKSEKILDFINVRGAATVQEIRQHVAKLDGIGKKEFKLLSAKRRNSLGQSLLYGTSKQAGVLERFCLRLTGGQYMLVEEIKPPFTPLRKCSFEDHAGSRDE